MAQILAVVLFNPVVRFKVERESDVDADNEEGTVIFAEIARVKCVDFSCCIAVAAVYSESAGEHAAKGSHFA